MKKTRDDQQPHQQPQLLPYYHLSRKIHMTPWSWQGQEFGPHRTQCHADPWPRRGTLEARLMGQTVQLAWVVVSRQWTGVSVWSREQGVISMSDPGSVPHIRSVRSDLNGVGRDTGNIQRTVVLWDWVIQFSIVFRDLPTSGHWPVLSFRIWSFKSSESNRWGRGKGRCSSSVPSQRISLMLQSVFSQSRHFWVLMPSDLRRILVNRLDILLAVAPHELVLKGLSQLNLSVSKSVPHNKQLFKILQW